MKYWALLLLFGCSSLETERTCRVTCEGCSADKIELYCDGKILDRELQGVK